MNTISCNVDQLIQGVLYNAVDLVAMSSSEIVNIIQCRVDEKPRAGHNIAKIIERRIRGRRGCSCEIECFGRDDDLFDRKSGNMRNLEL